MQGDEDDARQIDLSDDAGPEEASDPADRSGEKESQGEEAPEQARPLGNLTMDSADRHRPNATTTVFTWTGKLALDQRAANASFDLPQDTPFEVDIRLSWEGDANLIAELVSPTTNYLCSTASRIQEGPPESPVGCGAASLARQDPVRWTAHVQRQNFEVELPQSFNVTVTIRSLDPGTTPDTPSFLSEPTNETVDPGWPEPSQAPIRPGAKIDGGSCTMNFVFTSPDNRSLYVGTASHCLTGGPARLGDEVAVASGAATGTLVYCSWGAQERLTSCPSKSFAGDPGHRDDIALVRIPNEQRDQVHPALLVRGGPTRLGDAPQQGDNVFTYANSGLRDGYQGVNGFDSRPGVVQESDEAITVARFAVPGIPGDSGGPVIAADGSTVGVLSSLGRGANERAGSAEVSNLDRSLDLLEERTNRTIELATWPLFETPEPVIDDG